MCGSRLASEEHEKSSRAELCAVILPIILETAYLVSSRSGSVTTDSESKETKSSVGKPDGDSQQYLERIGADVEGLFHHVLAVLHDPAYREANVGALRMEWPRIPIPGWRGGDEVGAADELATSAARGRELAALLDSDTPVPGVTSGALRPEIAVIAVPSTTDGGNMDGGDFDVTRGWGNFGPRHAVMPGQGRVVERSYTSEEREAMGDAISVLGDTTYDIYLNDRAYWSNVPANVWGYKLGGYQVLKKWLSYRESKVLGRGLMPEEVQHFADTARRVGAILQ